VDNQLGSGFFSSGPYLFFFSFVGISSTMYLKRSVLVALLITPLLVFAQKQTSEVIAISFYNFENLFDTTDDTKNQGDDDFLPNGVYHYSEDIYRQKLHNLATVIKQLGTELTSDGPALIGTAEIENVQVLKDLAAQPEISGRRYQFVHFDSRDWRGIDVALLYNPKYFKVLTARALNVDISRSGEKGGRTRDVLYVTGILAGDTVSIFVNHWPSRRGGEAASAPLRAKAAGVSKRVIDSLRQSNPASKIILMGDLNDDPVSASVTQVLQARCDKGEVEVKDLYNPFCSFFRRGEGTLAYNDSWNLFDQIIVSGSFLLKNGRKWRYYKAEVFNRDFLKNKFGRYRGYPHRSFDGNNWINGYSDHFPTLIYLVKGK
jgi:hypothetical protein